MNERTNICSAFAPEHDAFGSKPAIRLAAVRLHASTIAMTHFACAMPQIWSEIA